MTEQPRQKILIFTSKTGGGHISLAEALRDRLSDQYTIEMIDPQPRVIHAHYRLVSRHALWLWAAEFRFSDTPARARAAHRIYSTLLVRNVAAALRRSAPDLVMTTYPFLTSEVKEAMRRFGQPLPFIMLFADPNGVHQSWLTEQGAEGVFAPTRETYDQALAAGFPPERLHLTGWPVRAQFYRDFSASRPSALAAMGLQPDRLTVFLQGGGEGAARFVRTVENLLQVENIQIILAAGTNRRLYRRFQHTPRLFALPFTKEIATYMSAADVVMGKAGPNMLFEAVTLGKPFIATAYIPGQEQANLEFIQRHHLGWVALQAADQRQLLHDLIASPARLAEVASGVEAYRQWNTEANQAIPGLVNELLPHTV